MSSVRITFTHTDMNTIMEALDCLDDEIKMYQGTQDPMRADISAVEDKIQAARGRMRRVAT